MYEYVHGCPPSFPLIFPYSFPDPEETLEAIHLPNPFYRIDDLNQLELQMRISSTKHIWEHPLRNQISVMSTQMIKNNHQELVSCKSLKVSGPALSTRNQPWAISFALSGESQIFGCEVCHYASKGKK